MPRELWLALAAELDTLQPDAAPTSFSMPLPKVLAFGETAVRFALAFHLSYVQFSQGYGTDFRPSQRRTAQA